ncbi:MAG: FGGY-family carbohydrate kinase [Eubacterium sp.]|nr:FGGY-family carbohydrate kinase [Eubacterium sp.]
MKESKYFMGIDLGTQSVRVVIADISGNVLNSDEQAYETLYPQAGWAEQRPSDWWQCLNAAMANVLKNTSMGLRYSICAVSVCATSPTILPVDENCEALTNAIMWMDNRATEETAAVNATRHHVLEYCGGEDSVEWTIPKMLWIKNHQPEIYQRAYKIIEQEDYINYRLCKKFTGALCQAACKAHYVGCEGGWSEDFFNQVGLSDYRDKMVLDVTRVGEVLGTIDREFAEKYDLNPEMLVVQGGIDAHIGMLGLGVDRAGKMAMIMGTSFVQLCLSEQKLHLDGLWGPYDEPVVEKAWLLEGGQSSAGSIVKWYMREFGIAEMDNPYAYMNEQVEKIAPGAEGLIALDFFQGNRTPYKDPNAKGMIYGLTLSHTKAHIYRALLEAVAFGTKNIIDSFEKNGSTVDTIVGCGGVTKDKVWMQIISDVTGKPIIVTEDAGASALGCAIVAAVGAKVYSNFEEATRGMVKEAYVVEPRPEITAVYSKIFEKYVALYQAVKSVMD